MIRRVVALFGMLAMLGSVPLAFAQAPAVVNLAWDYTGTGQTGFVMERKLGQGGTYAVVATLNDAAARTFSDTGIASGQIYCWQVRATAGGQLSLPSNEVCGAHLSAPVNLRITP
jgi:hypothetical protein